MTRLSSLVLMTSTLVPAAAWAQVGPGPLPGGGPGGQEEEKRDGVAEEAPRTPGILPTTPALPPPRTRRTRFQLLELDGYFRFRSDWMKNFNLSFRDDPAAGGAPFPRPVGCTPATEGTPAAAPDRPCGDSIRSANMRLRLEPRINLSETTSVHLQVDVLDNVVMGSTPTGHGFGSGAPRDRPLIVFGDDQEAPRAGEGLPTDSIVVKRAWAEIATPLGILKVGRMPDHWGLGMYRNSGAEDPIYGTYDLDADLGDSIDRLSFSTIIPTTRFRAAVAFDWPSSGLVSSQTDRDRGGQAFDLDDHDDVHQYAVIVSRMDSPQEFRDAVDRGELVANYGLYFTYRQQGWDYRRDLHDLGAAPDPDAFVPRDATIYIPNVWARIGWGNLLLEAEAVAVIGTINRVLDHGVDEAVKLRQWGGVGRFTYRGMDDKLRFGLELGAASGDSYDNVPAGATHVTNAQVLPRPGDDTISAFRFDREYKVDLILWRELYGAVTNAVYARPFFSYQLTDGINLRVQNVTSFALRPVATPGNAVPYGTEFDADLGYTSGAFHAGIAYGVLFPMSALAHPRNETGQGGDGFDWGGTDGNLNAGEPGNAHTVQARIMVRF